MNRTFAFFLAVGFVFRLVISTYTYSGDVNNHVSWGKDMLRNGPAGIYSRDFMAAYGTMTPTYPPLPLFVFTLSQLAFDKTYSTAKFLNEKFGWFPSRTIWFLEDQDTLPAFFKIWAILADAGLAFLVYKRAGAWVAGLGVLFNPAFWYNSAVWGQIESIPIFFVLLSWVTLKNSFVISAMAMTLALLTKQSSIIFLPVYLILFIKLHPPRLLLKSALIGLITFWLAFLPFFRSGNLFSFPFTTYAEKIRSGSGSNYVTDHAFNFWALADGLGKKPDTSSFWLGLPYVFWGYLFFGGWYLVILTRLREANMYLSAGLIVLGAFLFLTKMHERYLEPALPALLVVSWSKSLRLAFVGLSGVSLLNLYHGWWAPRIPFLVSLLSSVTAITMLIIILMISSGIYLKTYVEN